MATQDKTRESYDQWKELDNQLECFLNDALHLAGMRHLLAHSPASESAPTHQRRGIDR